ncbi:MAG: hypothetical protein U1A23_03730 [Candidatus Sungbacteria bacterium]|nr:hypothetical protein [bacterium]MDZ4286012.1 hypothetical protein [Candidatus Sungbacteria bacterium]
MGLQLWGDVILVSLQQVWMSIAAFIPTLFGSMLIFFIGLVIAVTLGQLVEQIVRGLKIDNLLRKLDVEKTIERAGWKMDSATFLGSLVRWFFIVVFLLAAANILGLSQVGDFLRDVLLYIPNVVIAALILIIAAVVADVVQRLLHGSIMAMDHRGTMVIPMVRWSIWIFALIAALLQLGVAVTLIQTLVTGLVAAIALAVGLAFGLGGKDAAAQFIDRMRSEMKK